MKHEDDGCGQQVRSDDQLGVSDATAALALLARMRFACGDNGKRMQDELEAYLVVLRKDAERYRWLRDPENKLVGESPSGIGIWEYRAGDELDAAIDAAMAGTGALDAYTNMRLEERSAAE